MGTPTTDWPDERTLGKGAGVFRWRLDAEGNVTIRRQGVNPLRVFRREHLERLEDFMSDRAWHPVSQLVEKSFGAEAAPSIQSFGLHSLGWHRCQREMAPHLSTVFAHAGLWEWNGERAGVMFRQVARGLERLRAYHEARCRGAATPAPAKPRPKLRQRPDRGPQFDLVATFRALSKGIRARLEASEGGHHPMEKGIRREAIVRDFLRSHLPPAYGVTNGEVISYIGEASRQTDALIYDALRAPFLLAAEGSAILPAESVYAAIEVKPTLTLTHLARAVANLSRLKSLPRTAITRPWVGGQMSLYPKANPPVFAAIFSFDTELAPARILEALNAHHKGLPPALWVDALFILDQFLIHRQGDFPAPQGWSHHLSDKPTPLVLDNSGPDALLDFWLLLLQDLNTKALLPPDLLLYSVQTRTGASTKAPKPKARSPNTEHR